MSARPKYAWENQATLLGLNIVQAFAAAQGSPRDGGTNGAGFTFGQVPSAGNLVIAVTDYNGGSQPTGQNGWTLLAQGGGVLGSAYIPFVYGKYATGLEAGNQLPCNFGGPSGWSVWEVTGGLRGVFAQDIANYQFQSPNAGAIKNFTDAGITTHQANETVLVALMGQNAIGYAVPTAMGKNGSGTLTQDANIGASAGITGTSQVSGHYKIVPRAGTALQESTSSANNSNWGVAWIELAAHI